MPPHPGDVCPWLRVDDALTLGDAGATPPPSSVLGSCIAGRTGRAPDEPGARTTTHHPGGTMLKRVTFAALSAAMLFGGFVFTTAAPAQADQRPCVSQAEYSHVI